MNKENVQKMPVAVLGGGVCAQTFAAEFALAGHEVRLYEMAEFAQKTLGQVLHTHEIELGGGQRNFKWFKRCGVAKIKCVTTDMATAVKGAGLIILALPAIGHQPFFEQLIPFLEDGQVVNIFPDNFGALILRRMMREKSCDAKVIVGGWSSMPYGVRIVEPGKVDCIMRIRTLCGEALPSKDSKRFLKIMRHIPAFDGIMKVERGDTILGIDLSNPNPAVHVPGSVLNVGAMEVSEMEGLFGIPPGKYSMYKHGMSPAVARVQHAFHEEELCIAKAMGIRMTAHNKEQFFWKGSIMGMEYWVPFVDVIMPPIVGPDSIQHRYFTEDIPVGTVVRYHLAKKFRVAVPVIESLINLGSAICGRDFLKEGRSLKDLGIADMTQAQIMRYVKTGAM